MDRPAPTPGPVALVGSGEYLPVMTEVEGALIAGRPPRFVQLATAAAPEGPASLGRWHALGRASAERLGVEQVVVPVVDRVSADDPGIAGLVAEAGMVYLSGGNPSFLTETLRGTAVWAAIEAAWRAGAALAGCSAGAMALGARVLGLRAPWHEPLHGLGVVPGVEVVPHFDRFAGRLPDALLRGMAGPPRGTTVVGIDEDTALVHEAGTWTVRGRQSVWLLTDDGRVEHPSGSTVDLPVPH